MADRRRGRRSQEKQISELLLLVLHRLVLTMHTRVPVREVYGGGKQTRTNYRANHHKANN